MKYSRHLSLVLLAFAVACAQAEDQVAFKGGVATNTLKKSDNAVPQTSESSGDDQIPAKVESEDNLSAPAPLESQVAEAPVVQALKLEVQLSAPDVRAGAQKVQAKAVLSGSSSSKIVWSLESAGSQDLGKIDSNGLFTSPANINDPTEVIIVATLEDDPSVVGKKSLKIIPPEQIFVGCRKGNSMFPISADVFKLEPNTPRLPDFSKMTKADIVCLDQYNIKPQAWDAGFPGATELQEWFGLRAKSKIIIPTAGKYDFRILSDDGSIVYIDNKSVINHDGTHSPSAKDGSVELSLGKHDLMIDYFQGPRVHIALQLFWKKPGATEYEIVPRSAFSEQ